jgi:4-alpha-glucanotransferase
MIRGSGVLLHLSSLPSPFGIGDMGPGAFRFIEHLAAAGQRYWQLLPLNPSNPENGESPYFSASTFAVNPLLISPDIMASDGMIDDGDITPCPAYSAEKVDFNAVREFKHTLLCKAWKRFMRSAPDKNFDGFCRNQAWWLDDYCLFEAFKRTKGNAPWTAWPHAMRDRHFHEFRKAAENLSEDIEQEKFVQWVAFSQWSRLKGFCAENNIAVIGDLPIYVSLESVDVWVNPHLFKLDKDKRPAAVSGVPPDYFSATGQLWNNPVYDWGAMRQDGFRWWERRFASTFERFDMVRIDHFRGLVKYWEVPAGETTAVNGFWQDVPTREFFDIMIKRFPSFPVIAEDLGIITPDVREAMSRYGFPGMKVLQFAFGEDNPDHTYLPHTYGKNCVAYTGTHDNMPFRAWFDGTQHDERERVFRYLQRRASAEEAFRALSEKLMQSAAELVIFPLQDLLLFGSESRMNDPAQTFGNWKWRCTPEQFEKIPLEWMRQLTEENGRAQGGSRDVRLKTAIEAVKHPPVNEDADRLPNDTGSAGES